MTVAAASLVPDTAIPYIVTISGGADILFPTDTTIALAFPRSYLVSFVVNAGLSANSTMRIVPRINGIDQPAFSVASQTGDASTEASASGTFILNTVLFGPSVTLDFLYTGTTPGLAPTGTFSIVEIQ